MRDRRCLIGFFLNLFLLQGSAKDVFLQSENAVLNQSVTLSCVTRPLNKIVQIADPSGHVAVHCTIPYGNTSTCFPGGKRNYVCSQDLNTGTTNITITSVEKSSGGSWTCTHGKTSRTLNVTVLTLPDTIKDENTLDKITLSADTMVTLMTRVECVCPSANITWTFVKADDHFSDLNRTFASNKCMDNGLTGKLCEDSTAKTFSCFFLLSNNSAFGLPPGKYKLKVGLTVEGQVMPVQISRVLSPVITVSDLISVESVCYPRCIAAMTVALLNVVVVTMVGIYFGRRTVNHKRTFIKADDSEHTSKGRAALSNATRFFLLGIQCGMICTDFTIIIIVNHILMCTHGEKCPLRCPLGNVAVIMAVAVFGMQCLLLCIISNRMACRRLKNRQTSKDVEKKYRFGNDGERKSFAPRTTSYEETDRDE